MENNNNPMSIFDGEIMTVQEKELLEKENEIFLKEIDELVKSIIQANQRE